MNPSFSLYLASQSPRRRQLLDQIGVAHELLLPDADEDAESLEAVQPGEPPADYVQRVTRLKLEAAVQRLARRRWTAAPILCADTTVTLDGAILGKPADDAHAAAMLRRLAGRSHQVLTAVALAHEGRVLARLSVSDVRLRELAPDEIERYVASGEPRGKAGSYAIQSQAAAWIEHIAGSYSGIMGLPLFETAELLRAIGRPV
jgi:septum formation protein